jgi:hypothetical protein
MAKRRKKQGNAAQLNNLQQGLTVDQVVNLVDKKYGHKII